ncbi:unnamed protein product, partial [Ectocarpus sp. 12 AP-2014]
CCSLLLASPARVLTHRCCCCCYILHTYGTCVNPYSKPLLFPTVGFEASVG